MAEAHADIKAAERLGKLFDELAKENSPEDISRHSLNLFFTRLLFCFFAEDTGIFTKGLFTEKVESLTQEDGSDLQSSSPRCSTHWTRRTLQPSLHWFALSPM